MTDVNDLIARLKMPSASGTASGAPNNTFGSIPLQQPKPQPAASFSPLSFPSSPPTGAASDRSNNLLSLLKFNRPTASQETLDSAGLTHSRNVSPSASPMLPSRDGKPPPAENPLLKLLNRPQPATLQASAEKSPSNVVPNNDNESTEPSNKPSLPQGPSDAKKSQVFTYVNPFDQLAASSPMKKNKVPPQPADFPQDASKISSSPAPSPLPDGRTRVEALVGIGAKAQASETVSEALDQIGPQADRDAREAVARAEGEEKSDLETITRIVSEMEHTELATAENAVREAATQMRDDLQNPESREVLKSIMPEPAAAAFETTVTNVASEGEVVGLEAKSAGEIAADPDAEVYQFPMRPFVAIDIKPDQAPTAKIRDDLTIKIASLKRDFDQVDRTLASATTNYIVYAMLHSKGGGFRIIRQDEGTSKHIFKKLGNSTFNLDISATRDLGAEPVLATDVNGSVYWTSVPISEPEQFADEDLEARGLIFPPLPSQEDNTSGAQLKTRAKLSSRHPEFFAVGRGKSIHIIWPGVALDAAASYIDPTSRVVDSEKYLTEQCLKIATGKAGKDFTFSEDDTLIASLDKAGRLKFWDVRTHTDFNNSRFKAGTYRHVEARTPLMTLLTCAPTEKSWATSVQFIDKDRPTAKGSALRYILVGSKQNHTLHLWDLGLGRPVQEVNFPHENELDAICSVVYHAKSGVLAVGHPTRNSIYLIHISAPRYNLSSSLTQAEYIRRLAEKDKTLPKPESTAIMSGMREVSLSNIGQLRSFAISPIPLAATPNEDALFELYVMHSNGVTCLNLTRQTVGSGRDGKPVNPVDAIAADKISLGEFKTPPSAEESHQSESSSKPEETPKKEVKEQHKEANASISKSIPKTKPLAASPPKSPRQQTGGAGTPAKKIPLAEEGVAQPQEFTDARSVSFAQMAQRADNASLESGSDSRQTKSLPQGPTTNLPRTAKAPVTAPGDGSVRHQNLPSGEEFGPNLERSISSAISNTLSDMFGKVLGAQLDSLYRRLDEEKRVQEAAGAAKQDAVLRLVSSTLTDNVEKSLARIITSNIQDSVLPSISNVTAATLDRNVSDALSKQFQSNIPKELKNLLPPAISKAVQDPEYLRTISDSISHKVTTEVEQTLSANFHNTQVPALKKLSADVTQSVTVELQAMVGQQLEQLNMQRQHDSVKIDQLTSLASELLETVKTMANTQAILQQDMVKLQQQLEQTNQATTEASPVPLAATISPNRDVELDEVAALMTTGRYEEGTIKWLQSARQSELFDKLFVQLSPSYLRSCNQIVTLSVSAAVTSSLDTHIAERLGWLEVALSSIDTQDPEIMDHAPGVMDHLTQRLQEVYMQISQETPSSPILAKVHALARQAKETKAMMGR